MKVAVISLIIIANSFFMSFCSQGSQQIRLPEITAESEEGFHDLVLAIEEHKELPDGAQRILGSGMYKGRKVSLEIQLGAAWRSSAPDADVPIKTFQGAVSYHSVGAESDLLLQAMDEVYGTKQAPTAMNKTTEFSAISLQGDPRDLT